jgi:hypothetical protein
MSRGHGKWERLIMQTLDRREAFYLLELFPPGLAPWEHRSDLRIRALRRAARNLGNAGKVRRFYDSRDRQRRLVIARRGVGVETLRRCLPRMSDRRRIELDLRLRDEESAASLTETDNELYLEPYHLSFPKIQSGGIRAVRQNQRIIQCDVCDHPPACNLHSRSVQVTTPA